MARLTDAYLPFNISHPDRLSDIEDIEVTIVSARLADAKFGQVAILEVVTPDGEKKTIVTGSTVVLAGIRNAIERNMLPLQATFYKQGQYWLYR